MLLKVQFVFFCVVAFLSATALSVNAKSDPNPVPVMVLGSENQIRGRQWNDLRIGYGVSSMITENLYEAGLFSLIEQHSAIRGRLDQIREMIWHQGYDDDMDFTDLELENTSWLAVGRLVYFGTPQTAISLGPVHVRRNEVITVVEVDLMEPKGRTITGQGIGVSSRTSRSAMFEFRDDQLLLNQTAVGIALQDAVSEAVKDLVVKYKKEMFND